MNTVATHSKTDLSGKHCEKWKAAVRYLINTWHPKTIEQIRSYATDVARSYKRRTKFPAMNFLDIFGDPFTRSPSGGISCRLVYLRRHQEVCQFEDSVVLVKMIAQRLSPILSLLIFSCSTLEMSVCLTSLLNFHGWPIVDSERQSPTELFAPRHKVMPHVTLRMI